MNSSLVSRIQHLLEIEALVTLIVGQENEHHKRMVIFWTDFGSMINDQEREEVLVPETPDFDWENESQLPETPDFDGEETQSPRTPDLIDETQPSELVRCNAKFIDEGSL